MNTIGTVLNECKQCINRPDAELLLAHVLNTSRTSIIARPERPVGMIDRLHFRRLVKKRSAGVPLAYLTGHKAFFGHDFLVNKHTLIPRPETELMVETAIEEIKQTDRETLLIDVGTGSGCIPISIIKTLGDVNTQTLAIDISRHALRVAKKNAKKHGADIAFLHGNLLEPLIQSSELLATGYELVITANLPYLTEEQFAEEPSIRREPKTALVANNSGLALYEELLKQIKEVITGYRIQVTSLFEIDPSQSKKIHALIKKYLPNARVRIKKDLRKQDRLVIVEA